MMKCWPERPSPTERGAPTGLEPLFAQVEQFRLLIVAKRKPTQFLPEAMAWLKDYIVGCGRRTVIRASPWTWPRP